MSSTFGRLIWKKISSSDMHSSCCILLMVRCCTDVSSWMAWLQRVLQSLVQVVQGYFSFHWFPDVSIFPFQTHENFFDYLLLSSGKRHDGLNPVGNWCHLRPLIRVNFGYWFHHRLVSQDSWISRLFSRYYCRLWVGCYFLPFYNHHPPHPLLSSCCFVVWDATAAAPVLLVLFLP